MANTMQALVYEAPYSMNVRDVDIPAPQPDEVLIRVAYSGICGSELSGFEGKNSLRKPPLIMGHEFTGVIDRLGDDAAARYPGLAVGQKVTANPLITCGECQYCQSGRPQLCIRRKLHSAALPGSNAQYIAIRADAVIPVPDGLALTTAALTEPAACAVHAARLGVTSDVQNALVIGAGPIGVLVIEALKAQGVAEIYCMELNPERRAMAEAVGATSVEPGDAAKSFVDLAVDAVGATPTRQACMAAARAGGRVVWVGLHEAQTALDINDAIRREITTIGCFAYTHEDFANALAMLGDGRLYLNDAWTRVEPLAGGAACFEELLHGSAVAKIWLEPPMI
jgi:2-desacetyl-2-hydroxyethyl bacteriochlorophyllide A dehydrogenase